MICWAWLIPAVLLGAVLGVLALAVATSSHDAERCACCPFRPVLDGGY